MTQSDHVARELIIHPGFPKTASTALQRGLFAHDATIAYLGKRASSARMNRASAELVRALLWSSERLWCGRGEGLVSELSAAAGETDAGAGPMLLSYEEMLGSCFGVFRVCNRFGRGRHVGLDPAVLADRIGVFAREAWHGPVRLMLTVRRQDTFLASLFAQTFLWRHASSANTLDRFLEAVCDTEFHSAGGLALEYDWLIERFEQALGKDRVHVLVYEDIAEHPRRFADGLERVTGIAAADTLEQLAGTDWKVRSTDQHSWRVQRYRGSNRLRHAVQSVQRRLAGIPNPADIVLTDEQSRLVMETFADSNRRLATRLDRPLDEHGYY